MRVPCLLLLLLAVMGLSVRGQETLSAVEVLTLDQGLAEAQENNRLIKISKQSVLAANDQILAARTQRLPHFNVLMTGGSLISPVGVEFNQGVFGTVNGVPIPPKNTTVTTNPQLSGFGFGEVYQPLAELYNIHLNIEALQVGKRLVEEPRRSTHPSPS